MLTDRLTPDKSLRLALALVGAVLGLGGCADLRMPGIYRIDIQQGNVVTQEMLDQLEPGMDRRKVRFILGTPLITDTFNADRWDYVYSFKEGGGERVQRRVSVYFENDALARVQGDVRSGFGPGGEQPRKETIVTVPAGRKKEGLLAALIPDVFEKKPVRRRPDEGVAAKSTEAAPPPAAATTIDTAASEDAARPGPPSDEDVAYLERLFSGYGKMGEGESETQPAEPQSRAGER